MGTYTLAKFVAVLRFFSESSMSVSFVIFRLFHVLFLYRSPLPYRRPMHVVVGGPIEVKKNSLPTMEEVRVSSTSFEHYVYLVFATNYR